MKLACCLRGTSFIVSIEYGANFLSDRDLHKIIWLRHHSKGVGTIPNTLQPVNPERVLAHDVTDLVVFALIELHVHPGISVLPLFHLNYVGAVLHPVNCRACPNGPQFLFVEHSSEDPDTILSL